MTDLPPTNDDSDDAEVESTPPTADSAGVHESPAQERPHPEPPHHERPRTAPGPPPPRAEPAPRMRRIYRSRDDRKIAGVAAGAADYFRVDPTVVRLAAVLFAFTGIGLLLYLVAWVIVPTRPPGLLDPPTAATVPDERTMTIAFGVTAIALAIGIVTGSWAALAIALVAGGIWLLSEQPRPEVFATSSESSASAPTVDTAVDYAAATRYASPYEPPATRSYGSVGSAAADTGGAFPPPYTPAGPPAGPRRPQRITWTVLAALALFGAVGVAASAGDWWDLSPGWYLGIGIIAILTGVLAGQIAGGGARGLIPLGILATLALVPVTVVGGLIDEGIGEVTYTPRTIDQLESGYDHGIGKLTVDLSQLDFADDNNTDDDNTDIQRIEIDLAIGELIVIVSDDTGGTAELQATAGEIRHDVDSAVTRADDGVNIDSGTLVLEGDDGLLELDVSVGFGKVELRTE